MLSSRGFYIIKEFDTELEEKWRYECKASGKYFIILRMLPHGIDLEWSCATGSQYLTLNQRKKYLVDMFLQTLNQKHSKRPSLCKESLKHDVANNILRNLKPKHAENTAKCLSGFFERILNNKEQFGPTYDK